MKGSFRAAPLLGITILMLLLFSVEVPSTEAAISCGTVIQDLAPCVSYLKTGKGMPPPTCCSGAKALVRAASTTADKRVACGCLKSASKSLNPNPVLAKSLPGKCGINLGFTISASVDCTKIA